MLLRGVSTGSLLSLRENRTIRGPGSLLQPQQGGRLCLRQSTCRKHVPESTKVGFQCFWKHRCAHLSNSAYKAFKGRYLLRADAFQQDCSQDSDGQPLSSLLLTLISCYLEKNTQSWEADKPHNLEEIMYLAGVELSRDARLWSHSVLSLPTGS